MSSDRQSLDKLVKVLALADSAQEGEALAALRAARQLMEKLRLSFADMVMAAFRLRTRGGWRPDAAADAYIQSLQDQVRDLMQRTSLLQRSLDVQTQRAQMAQKAAEMAAVALARAKTDNDQWRHLARDTAEKLWDLGRQMEHERQGLPIDPAEARRRAALQFLEETQALLRKDELQTDGPSTGERLN